MKKILIVINSLHVGGVATALSNMLEKIDLNANKLELFLFNGENKEILEQYNVKILKENKILKMMNYTKQESKERGIITYIIRNGMGLLCKIFGANQVYGIIYKFIKKNKNYDIAISYINNGATNSLYFGANKYVLEKVEAKQKVAWVHVDYELLRMDDRINRREYYKFDKIVFVSKAIREKFIEFNPSLTDKSIVIYNYINRTSIIKKSQQVFPYENENCKNILIYVGRIEESKAQDVLVKILDKLLKNDVKAKLILIGDGPDKKKLLENINQLNIQDQVKIYPYMKNPYPYIAGAKLLLSASKTESFGMVIAEALELGTPVIAKKYPALKEIIENEKNGLIVDSNEDLFKKTYELLTQDNEYIKLKSNTKLYIEDKLIEKQISEIFEVKNE